MPESSEQNIVQVPVSLTDLDGLRELEQVYTGILNEEVVAVAGDNLAEIIEVSQSLAGRIETTIGSVATSTELSVGIVEISEDENKILESARRIRLAKSS